MVSKILTSRKLRARTKNITSYMHGIMDGEAVDMVGRGLFYQELAIE
jgi:hypothetical protein